MSEESAPFDTSPLDALPPRRRAFVQAYADPASPTFGNGTQAAISAGYAPGAADVEASRLLGDARVSNGVRALLDAGLSPQYLSQRLRFAIDDDDPKVRPSTVRAIEIGMRAQRMLGADTEVSIDARTAVLPELPDTAVDAILRALESNNESRTA